MCSIQPRAAPALPSLYPVEKPCPFDFARLTQEEAIMMYHAFMAHGGMAHQATMATILRHYLQLDHCSVLTKMEAIPSQQCRESSRRRVHFADEVTGGALVDVIEVESLKDAIRFTASDRAIAETEWREQLLVQFENATTDEQRKEAASRIEGVVVELAISKVGHAVVERALVAARGVEEQNLVLRELRGHVVQLMASPFGCEVLQTCIESLRPKSVNFVLDELLGTVAKFACTEHGHQVVCRILEHISPKMSALLIDELLFETDTLCCHEWGSVVVQHLFDYGTATQQVDICKVLASSLHAFSRHRVARNVVEHALRCACTEGRTLLRTSV